MISRTVLCFDFFTFRLNLLTNLTNSMEQSPSWEANRCSASQDFPSFLWKRKKFNCCGHKSLLLAPILNQINLVQVLVLFLRFTSIIFLLRWVLSICFFPPCIPRKILYAPLLSPIRATWYLIRLDLITLIIFGEAYRTQGAGMAQSV